MKTNHTDITMVLDRSGSMARVAADTIGGVNQLLKDQRAAPGTASITLHQFDDVYETVIKETDVKNAPDLTDKTFVPRGSTALLDAIGRAIAETGARLGHKPEAERAGKVVFVIVTDGQENASTEHSRENVLRAITHQRDKYAWEFVFLGANQDAIATATSIGVASGNAMTYAHNAVGTAAAFASTSNNLRKMRSGHAVTMSYSAEDHAAQQAAGLKGANPAGDAT